MTPRPPPVVPVSIVSRTTVHSGFCRIEQVRFVRPDDERVFSYEIESHGHGAAVLAYDPNRRVAVLVRQLRLPQALDGDEGFSLEVIAGLLDTPQEEPEVAVRREAMEEAGLELESLVRIASARSMPGLSTEKLTLFLAEVDLSRASVGTGGGVAHEGEHIEVKEVPLANMALLADEGNVFDLKTMVLVQTLRLKRPELFRP